MTDTPRSGIKSRPKDAERPTRKPMRAWDRIKVFLFLLACFFALVWASMAGDQLANVSTSFRDAFRESVQSYWWLPALAALEVIRQLHYVLAESSPAITRSGSACSRGGSVARAGGTPGRGSA